MKLLFYRHIVDLHFESLISVLSKTKYQCGYLTGEVNQETINSFAPDVIIHNIPNTDNFPIKNSAISININENDSKNSFSLVNEKSKNYIGNFVHFKSSHIQPNEVNKFSSDILYIGSPGIFGHLLDWILNSGFNFKFFTHQPHNIKGYCGMCSLDDYARFYKHSKVSLVTESDHARIRDIVVFDGNPIIYDGSNLDECKKKIEAAILDCERYSVDGYSKEEITAKHTSYDRAAFIFKTVGLTKIAEDIMKIKKLEWQK